MKTKLLLLVVLMLMAGMLSGCGSGVRTERVYLKADFEMTESQLFLTLDASNKTEAIGITDLEFFWNIGGHQFDGPLVEVPLPHGEIDVSLTVIGTVRNREITDTVQKLYQPSGLDPKPDPDPDPVDPDPKDPDPDPEVHFQVQRIGELYYEFTANEPENAKFWEWKFPGQTYWEGYINNNKATHSFSSAGEVEVKLAIFDEYGEQIGETYSLLIEVY